MEQTYTSVEVAPPDADAAQPVIAAAAWWSSVSSRFGAEPSANRLWGEARRWRSLVTFRPHATGGYEHCPWQAVAAITACAVQLARPKPSKCRVQEPSRLPLRPLPVPFAYNTVALQSTLAATLLAAPYIAGAMLGTQAPAAGVLHDAVARSAPSSRGPVSYRGHWKNAAVKNNCLIAPSRDFWWSFFFAYPSGKALTVSTRLDTNEKNRVANVFQQINEE